MSDLHLVYRNLFHKKIRTILMIIAIFIAFLIFGILASYKSALNRATAPGESERMITVNKINFTQPLPIADYKKIQAMPDVAAASHQDWFGGYFADPKNFLFAFAVDVETFPVLLAERSYVDPEDLKAWAGDRTGVLIGSEIAVKYGWKIGDQVPLSSNIYSRADGSNVWPATVRGIYHGANNASGVYVNYEYFNESRTFGKDTTNMIIFQTR